MSSSKSSSKSSSLCDVDVRYWWSVIVITIARSVVIVVIVVVEVVNCFVLLFVGVFVLLKTGVAKQTQKNGACGLRVRCSVLVVGTIVHLALFSLSCFSPRCVCGALPEALRTARRAPIVSITVLF